MTYHNNFLPDQQDYHLQREERADGMKLLQFVSLLQVQSLDPRWILKSVFPELIVLHLAWGCKSVIKTKEDLKVHLCLCGGLIFTGHQVATKPFYRSTSPKGQWEKTQLNMGWDKERRSLTITQIHRIFWFGRNQQESPRPSHKWMAHVVIEPATLVLAPCSKTTELISWVWAKQIWLEEINLIFHKFTVVEEKHEK